MASLPYGALLAAVAVAALVVLAVMLLSLWRKTKSLMRAVATANETVAAATEALEQVQTPASRSPAQAQAARHPTDSRRSPARHR